MKFSAKKKGIAATRIGSTPPPNDSLWKAAESQGFEVTTYERGLSGEKAVDTELVVSGLYFTRYNFVHPDLSKNE
ncbi:MAG: hypothetical protein LBG45_03905 [Dysgonamonadaceae bacterium]|jgi:hypothetical protein|nr:hypothetical protein [Dysgonamonadaceae bacterium]